MHMHIHTTTGVADAFAGLPVLKDLQRFYAARRAVPSEAFSRCRNGVITRS